MIETATSDSNKRQRSDCDPDSVAEPVKKECRLHFFHMYFTSGYYFCIVPFRPVFNRISGHRELQGNGFQKILCYMLWTMAMINRITDVRSAWQDDRKHRTISYFKLAHAHTHIVLNILFYHILVSKVDKIKELVELIGHSKLLHPTPRHRWILVMAFHIIWVVFGFLAPVFGFEVIDTGEWASSYLFRVYVARAKYAFFLDTNCTRARLPVERHDVFGTSCFLGIFQILITLAHNLQLFFIVCLFTTCSLTVWSASVRFIEEVMEKKYKSRVDFYKNFQELRNVCHGVNEVWNLFCFWYLLDLLAWLSTELDTGLMTHDWFVKLYIFYYLTCLGSAVIFSAESYRKMQKLRVWLIQQSEDVEGLQIVSNGENAALDPTWNNICIGSSGFYKINYRFIGKITATIITFFIISVEYKEDKKIGTRIQYST